MKLSHADIQALLRLLDEAQYTELRLETDGLKLWLRRGSDGHWIESTEITTGPQLLQPAAAVPAVATASASTPASGKGFRELRSPLPGTFYRSPQPGAPPFVEVGDEVREDTVVCIVETMKLMNSIHAGVRGTVREICLQNGAPAARDQVLLRIEAAGG